MINKPSNWDEVAENEVVENISIKIGAYPCQIKEVIDHPEKEYFEVRFDIVSKDPDLNNYFLKLKESLGMEADAWPNQGIYRVSYKESATRFFKAFITAIQKSNQGYVWNWNIQTLKGKYMIANYGEEEYESLEGDIKIAVKVREIRSIEAWRAGEVKELPLKKLKVVKKETNNPFANLTPEAVKEQISDDDLPF